VKKQTHGQHDSLLPTMATGSRGIVRTQMSTRCT